MNGIEKNHSRVVAVFLDELESLMVIGSIGVVCQVLDFIQVFFVERIGKRFPIIVKSCFAGRLAVAFGGGLIIAFILPAEWIVAILAVVLIIFGICGFK